MEFRLDKNTIREFEESGIQEIQCSFIQSGCAGTKIRVTPISEESEKIWMIAHVIHENLICYFKPSEVQQFDGAIITKAQGKWIFTSSKINTRCSCGSSFSLKTGDKMKDAIRKFQAMKQKSNHNTHETP